MWLTCSFIVQEWCEMSVRQMTANELQAKSSHRDNFMSVASRASSHHLVYHRDLPFLLPLSMTIKEYGLALDLGKDVCVFLYTEIIEIGASHCSNCRFPFHTAGEILEDPILCVQRDAVDLVLQQLRLVGLLSLDEQLDGKPNATRNLRRILRLYSKAAFRQFFKVPTELVRLIEHRTETGKHANILAQPHALEVIRFLAEEALPNDLLAALSICCSNATCQPELVPILKQVLSRGASSGTELSAALLKVKRARQRLGILHGPGSSAESDHNVDGIKGTVWRAMALGQLVIDK
jgi:hypothetical protein